MQILNHCWQRSKDIINIVKFSELNAIFWGFKNISSSLCTIHATFR